MALGKIYESWQMNSAQVKNRLVASAMYDWAADDGRITERLKKRYAELAAGGVGLIITGMMAVSESGSVTAQMVNTEYPGFVADLREMADAAHAHDARLMVQLQHCGHRTAADPKYDSFAVSRFTRPDGLVYEEATVEQIQGVVKSFAAAAVRCKEAGADGVQIHSTHGYFLNTFLSPSTNHRTDEYGGCIENRARFLFEVLAAVREAVGEDYPVAVKLAFNDLCPESTTPEEALWVCRELEKRGIDMVEVSSGMVLDDTAASFSPRMKKGEDAAPFLSYAKLVAQEIAVPVVSVCGYRTPQFVAEVLENTNIAAIAFGRPLICEPELPNRWQTDETPAECLSCNMCSKDRTGDIIICRVKKK